MRKLRAAILGATGTVGQRLIELLEDHPWFEVGVVCASAKSVGRQYSQCTPWVLRSSAVPKRLAGLQVEECTPEAVEKSGGADLVFSALPSDAAMKTELEFASAGYPVFSKASAYRMEKDVPLVIPEVNPQHCKLVEVQKKNRGYKGFISTDPNCSTTQLALTLAPLRALGLKSVRVATMQAVSGAGYPGVASLDIIDNVIPFINGEEAKICSETAKILGDFGGPKEQVVDWQIPISATCNRVPVTEGHMESVFVEFREDVCSDDIVGAWNGLAGEPIKLNLPSATKPLHYLEEESRPQHRFDLLSGKGMTVTIGRLEKDAFGFKYQCLGHNTIRGAAGESILQAELFKAYGMLG